jgi:uncharacterized protein
MKGMSAVTGKALEGIAHLKQSIVDILTTPMGSRIMRREYGSRLFSLVDHPISPELRIELYAATSEALAKWEKRFSLRKVKIGEVSTGKITLFLEGTYLPEGKPLTLEVHV